MRILVLGMLLLITACDTTRPLRELHGITPPVDPYRAALVEAYSEYAQQRQDNYDWWDSKYFAEKGLKAANGEVIEPETPDHWEVSDKYAPELRKARHQLLNVLEQSKTIKPEQSAYVLAAYDRWVVVASEGWNIARIQEAHNTFYKLLPKTAQETKPKKAAKPITHLPHSNDFQKGTAYFQGKVYPKDDVKALEYFRKSAKAGDANGQYSLAYMYSVGLGGVAQDWGEANNWLMKAAKQGHARAMDDLGVSYGDGRGIAQDWVECYKWITLAARRGDLQAIKDLDYAKARMTKEQIKKATELADGWGK